MSFLLLCRINEVPSSSTTGPVHTLQFSLTFCIGLRALPLSCWDSVSPSSSLPGGLRALAAPVHRLLAPGGAWLLPTTSWGYSPLYCLLVAYITAGNWPVPSLPTSRPHNVRHNGKTHSVGGVGASVSTCKKAQRLPPRTEAKSMRGWLSVCFVNCKEFYTY